MSRARVDINAILAAARRPARYGAPMGARSYCDGGPDRLYLQRVRFSDGCYAPDGTYWGAPADLWCAFSYPDDVTRLYVRAPTRAAALEQLRADYADLQFHRVR